MKTVLATSHMGVLRHLRKTGSATVRHIWKFEGVWNPAGRANVDDRVYGPGEAHYTLDESGIVTSSFTSAEARCGASRAPSQCL